MIDLGFYFCQFIATYGLDYEATLNLPVDTFWMMLRNIPRVRAESASAQLEIGFAAARGDPKSALEELKGRVGTVLVLDEQLDRGGLQRLKAMTNKGKA